MAKQKQSNSIPAGMAKVKNDPSVKEAAKKEQQPMSAEDLSPLHNTNNIGTTGADQRQAESIPSQKPESAKKEIRPQK